MAVNLDPPDPATLAPVPGVELGVAEAGIRKARRKDLLVMRLAEGRASQACSRTTASAPRRCSVCREHLGAGRAIRALVVNTGNANCGTGEAGLARAARTCEAVARSCSAARRRRCCRSRPASSWSRCRSSASKRRCRAASRRWAGRTGRDAAAAIMTTDTLPKAASRAIRDRRRRRHRHRHRQGRRHDPAEHGDDARLRRDRRAVSAARAPASSCARPPTARSTASPSTATRRPTTRSC